MLPTVAWDQIRRTRLKGEKQPLLLYRRKPKDFIASLSNCRLIQNKRRNVINCWSACTAVKRQERRNVYKRFTMKTVAFSSACPSRSHNTPLSGRLIPLAAKISRWDAPLRVFRMSNRLETFAINQANQYLLQCPRPPRKIAWMFRNLFPAFANYTNSYDR